MKTCPDCNGDGVIEKGTDDEEQCPRCGGSGIVPNDNDDKNNEEAIKTLVLAPRSVSQEATLTERLGPHKNMVDLRLIIA
jgi:RecJ-like exonuclease